MNILHICSYYIGNKLYKNLIKNLSSNGVKQHVFIPLKNDKHKHKNQLPSDYKNINYYYSSILNKYDRLLYFKKISKQMYAIEQEVLKKSKIDFVHAHTVFSDGGTAYKLHLKYRLKYIVNVRNTDINFFYKYAYHLRPFMYKILLNSSAITFISPAYKKQLLSMLPDSVSNEISERCHVIPNGIDPFWHESENIIKWHSSNEKIKLLFIGQLNNNKNVSSIIVLCAKLHELGYETSLQVIGDGPNKAKLENLCDKFELRDKVVFHGHINEKDTILSIMDKCDLFIMPSFKETFGLVYIEAMSRGLPVIFTKDQGIDGFFNEGDVGFSVDAHNIEEMIKAVESIISNYEEISNRCVYLAKTFNWADISRKYKQQYSKNISLN